MTYRSAILTSLRLLAGMPSSHRGGGHHDTRKHLVFVAGDEEYRSEESLPALAAIMKQRHGFDCTVLFSVDDLGRIDPDDQASLDDPRALDTADALILAIRFRNWTDDTMKRFEAAWKRGIPIIGLRTSTHAFRFPDDRTRWLRYSHTATADTGWPGGFGREFLGETWVSHHGRHLVQGTRAVVEPANADHPVLMGVADVFGDTNVYAAGPVEDAVILLRGAVTESLDPRSVPVEGPENDPMQPVAWVRTHENGHGTVNRVFATTMGSATDFESEDLRRLVINAIYWGLDMDVPARADASFVEPYEPSPFGFGRYQKGIRPANVFPR